MRPEDKGGDSQDRHFGYEQPDQTETEERDSDAEDAGESEAEIECDPSSENEEASTEASDEDGEDGDDTALTSDVENGTVKLQGMRLASIR